MTTFINTYQSSQRLSYILCLDVCAKFPLVLLGDNVGVVRQNIFQAVSCDVRFFSPISPIFPSLYAVSYSSIASELEF